MPIYKIAGEAIDFEPLYESNKRLCAGFLSQKCEPAFSFKSDFNSIKEEMLVEGDFSKNSSAKMLESNYILRKIATYFLESGKGFVFHGSAVKYRGKAYVFTGVSGAGKSTHAALWKSVLGEKLTYINDDKPIIKKINGDFYVFGTPWKGKHELGENDFAPLGGIAEIVKSKNIKVVDLPKSETIALFLNQTLRPTETKIYDKLLPLLGEIMERYPIKKLYCDKSEKSAKSLIEEFTGEII